MRVFVTGATGFIGSSLVPELINAGHQVTGLCRSDAGAEALHAAGAEVCRGDINDLDLLYETAKGCDGVIHTAFNHDFANLKEHSEHDRKVITTFGNALSDHNKPFIITSGTGLVRSKPGRPAVETDDHMTAAEFARAATEEAADALTAKGGHVMVMRLPQVHDVHKQGRIAYHIQLARQKGWVAYISEGLNRLPAAHVTDVARLYRLALEKGRPGARYHAVAEDGVTMRDIAHVIGERLKLPVRAITPGEAPEYFGLLAQLAMIDLAASGALTREQLAWEPTGPDLLSDLRNME